MTKLINGLLDQASEQQDVAQDSEKTKIMGNAEITPVQPQNVAVPAGATDVESTTEVLVNADIKQIGPDVRKVQEQEITRMSADVRFHLMQIPETFNAVVNITEAFKEGVEFYKKKDNRIHGKDREKTGKSMMLYGAQLPLSICPVKEAKAAGVGFERFPDDPHKDGPISEDGFMIVEGHGRMEYLMSEPIEKWPTVLGVFPAPNGNGEIHIENGFQELNENDTIWGGKDYILIRLSDPGAHPGWRFIKELEDKGLRFTIATIFATGSEGNITKRNILDSNSETANELFKHLDHGKRLYKAAEKAFSVDRGSAITTKGVPKKLFSCWSELMSSTKMTADDATKYMVKFLEAIKENDKAEKINSAKKDGDKDRDTVRKELFTLYFDEYKMNTP